MLTDEGSKQGARHEESQKFRIAGRGVDVDIDPYTNNTGTSLTEVINT